MNDLFNDLKKQVERGAKLVSNVRTLSKIENVKIQLKSIDAFQVLKKAINNVSESHQDDLKIDVESIDRNYEINADELLIEVFENILINSIRHNKNRVIEVFIRSSKVQIDGNGHVKIEFIDNGNGIEDSQKEIIFKRGFEKSKSANEMGLGLSLVKKIIQSYHGQIWVEDRVEGDYSKGSVFIVAIPEAE